MKVKTKRPQKNCRWFLSCPSWARAASLNYKGLCRFSSLRCWQGTHSARRAGLLILQGHIGINAGSATCWDPTSDRRGGQKNQSDDHKGKRIARADIMEQAPHERRSSEGYDDPNHNACWAARRRWLESSQDIARLCSEGHANPTFLSPVSHYKGDHAV